MEEIASMNYRIRRDLVEVLTNILPGVSIWLKPQASGLETSVMVDVSCWIVKIDFKKEEQLAIFQVNSIYLEFSFDDKVFDHY